jgi:hypothetical protein
MVRRGAISKEIPAHYIGELRGVRRTLSSGRVELPTPLNSGRSNWFLTELFYQRRLLYQSSISLRTWSLT